MPKHTPKRRADLAAPDEPRVKDLGEFGLIARIAGLLPAESGQLLVGIGDDASAFLTPEGSCLLLTTDVMVEGVHFRRGWGTWRQLGKKAMMAASSDVAAMGGRPLWALASLAVEADTPLSAVDGIYQGMADAAQQVGAVICGGDTVRSPSGISLGVTVVGECAAAAPVIRGGAQPGDSILLTGFVGSARAGLALLEHRAAAGTSAPRRPPPKRAPGASPRPAAPADAIADWAADEALKAHLEPTARWQEGAALAGAGAVNSMIDVSDGLLADLEHIRTASDVGAELDSQVVPIAECCKVIAAALGENALTWAMEGGEDYELLLTCPPEKVETARQLVLSVGAVQATVIGSITRDKGIRVACYQRASKPGGYRHF
jgi:thiamine-monophosphate kinase